MVVQAALLMIRHIQAVSQQRLPVRATDSIGDGSVRLDSVLIMFVSVRGWIVLCFGSLYKGFSKTVLDVEREQQIIFV